MNFTRFTARSKHAGVLSASGDPGFLLRHIIDLRRTDVACYQREHMHIQASSSDFYSEFITRFATRGLFSSILRYSFASKQACLDASTAGVHRVRISASYVFTAAAKSVCVSTPDSRRTGKRWSIKILISMKPWLAASPRTRWHTYNPDQLTESRTTNQIYKSRKNRVQKEQKRTYT